VKIGKLCGEPARLCGWHCPGLRSDGGPGLTRDIDQGRAHDDVNEIDTDGVRGDNVDAIAGSPDRAEPHHDAAGKRERTEQ
jgi:hypothetical protein